MSYPRESDARGKISYLREALEEEVRGLTGERGFEIFQDITLGLGQQWEQRLRQEINQAYFLVPIVQPLYFSSEKCRAEAEAFLAREQTLGSDDLVLPIYYIECDDFSPQSRDWLCQNLAKRQYVDFRKLRNASQERVDKAVIAIAGRMKDAFRRAQGPSGPSTRSARPRTPEPEATAGPSTRSARPRTPEPEAPDVSAERPGAGGSTRAQKLRVMLVAASPTDQDELQLDAEQQAIEAELRNPSVARRVRIDVDSSTTPEHLLDSIGGSRPALLHFSGHGNQSGEPLLLSPFDASSQAVPATLLEDMMRRSAQLRCIVFNGCYTTRVAKELVRRLPLVVIGMRSEVGDDDALLFAQHLYRSIARGHSLRDAFDDARTALRTIGSKYANLPQISVHSSVDADEIVLLPAEPHLGPDPGTDPPAASAHTPPPGKPAASPNITPEQRRQLVRLLLSMFSSDELLRLLRYSSDTAPVLLQIPKDSVAPMTLFTAVVDQLAQERLLDRRFFDRVVRERPRWASDLLELQDELFPQR